MFKKNSPAVGSRPGTLSIPPGSPEPVIKVIQYSEQSVELKTEFKIEALKEGKNENGAEGIVTWVDIQGFGNESVLKHIASVFGLHPIALENAINVPQRAKVEDYGEYLLVVARTPLEDKDKGDEVIGVPQVCFILGDNFVLSFQEKYFGFFDAIRARINEGIGPIRKNGAAYLLYALVDGMVDRYLPMAQDIVDELEVIEAVAIDNTHPGVLTAIRKLRRKISLIRRIGYPQKEALRKLQQMNSRFFNSDNAIYLKDTYDNLAQVVELLDAVKDEASDLANDYLSTVSFRSNEIMKVLTLMASIFIPLTFVAGIYGMNFEYMPELAMRRGYFIVWGVMVVIIVVMLSFFWKKGWLGQSRSRNVEKILKK